MFHEKLLFKETFISDILKDENCTESGRQKLRHYFALKQKLFFKECLTVVLTTKAFVSVDQSILQETYFSRKTVMVNTFSESRLSKHDVYNRYISQNYNLSSLTDSNFF